MSSIKAVCSICPMECEMTILVGEGKVISVEGNGCIRGLEYAKTEAVNPKRQFTTTVKIYNARYPLLPVRTTRPISLEYVPILIKMIKETEVIAPINIGDVILENIFNTGIDVIASRSLAYNEKLNY